MKVKITAGDLEAFFIHDVDDEYDGKEIEAPLESVERWKRTAAEFDRSQNEIGEALERKGFKL